MREERQVRPPDPLHVLGRLDRPEVHLRVSRAADIDDPGEHLDLRARAGTPAPPELAPGLRHGPWLGAGGRNPSAGAEADDGLDLLILGG